MPSTSAVTPKPQPAQQPTQQALRAAFLAPATRAAQWLLPMGAAAVPLVHRGAQALMLLSGAMAWAWAWSAMDAIWPMVFALGWTWHVVRLWRAWCSPTRCLLLCWQAQPSCRWLVAEWGDGPVHVRSLWDGQAALLLRLRAADGAQRVWLWVRDDGGRDIHRLRTLLAMPQAAPDLPVA